MVNRIIDMEKNMAKLLVDIPDELHKKIRHRAIDDDVSIKDLVTNVLEENFGGKTGKTKDQQNIEKLMGKKK